MKLKFDSKKKYQLDAVSSVVELFEGQPRDTDNLVTLTGSAAGAQGGQDSLPIAVEVGAVGNNLIIDDETILQNLQAVQNRSGLAVNDVLVDGALDFDIEMETGTGKTYVYLRTVFELAQRYNFTKFIILVPSVPIREGVKTNIADLSEHLRGLYNIPFDFTVYSGKTPEGVLPFATSTSVQIMVMTIDAIRGDASNRIIHQTRDKLNGLKPIDYLSATRPVVIMDEPQNMESELSQSAIGELDPLCTLRYSATHRVHRNVVYRLDPVDAHEQGLVKQIVVAEVSEQGAAPTPYIKLVEVKRNPWAARLELMCRNSSGEISRKTVTVRQDRDLADVTKNPAYDNNWRIVELSYDPAYVELTNHGILQLGEQIGGSTDAIYREMVRETIREHLRKELQLRALGIKVLSLFFVDRVASFLGDGTNNLDADGKFVQWFDALFVEERAKNPAYKELLPQEPKELRRAYFAELRTRGRTTFVDSSGAAQKDDDAYDLIMRDRSGLLDQAQPVRFVFSHTALREGWDNPNVFQICTLREIGGEIERRQTIGRGLRLPVDQDGDQVHDEAVAQLTVVANESYQTFAASLQDDYVRAGVAIGYVRRGEFAKLPFVVDGEDKLLGTRKSEEIWAHLQQAGFLDATGKVLGTFAPSVTGFTLNLPEDFKAYEAEIVGIIDNCRIERIVKKRRNRVARQLNKELFLNPQFETFWKHISARTTYRVKVDRNEVIKRAVEAIKGQEPIKPLRVQVSRAGIKILRGGAQGDELSHRSTALGGAFDLPDILAELQEATSLTRKTLIEILVGTGRLGEFVTNPNDFIQMVAHQIKRVLEVSVVDGIQYDKIDGSLYELRELQEDGAQERDRFIDQMYKVQHPDKTDFDYVVYDSDTERRFAALLDSRDDIKFFMKLPSKFRVPTPVGDYIPDWAIIKEVDGQDRLYMIRETKSTRDDTKLRPTEVAKMKCGKEHFKAIGVEDYRRSTPEDWNI